MLQRSDYGRPTLADRSTCVGIRAIADSRHEMQCSTFCSALERSSASAKHEYTTGLQRPVSHCWGGRSSRELWATVAYWGRSHR